MGDKRTHRQETRTSKRLMMGVLALALLGTAVIGIGPGAADEPQAPGGPMILMGLDSEDGPNSSSHGPRAEHAAMVESLLDAVTNGGEGILVIGGTGSRPQAYWDLVGEDVGEDVTFVLGAEDVGSVSFDGFAMIGVASSFRHTFQGLTNAENDALVDRRVDLADFVNNGGGLLGKTQAGLSNPWGYVDPLGEFEMKSTGFSSVVVEQAGLDLGLTQQGMDGWCCYHETFPEFPSFFEVLITNDHTGSAGFGEAAAIGGIQVVLPGAIELDPVDATGTAGETHTMTALVRDSDLNPLEGETVGFEVTSGPNAGTAGSDVTNGTGHATFTYPSDGTAGNDTIEASFTDATGVLRAASASMTWERNDPVESCGDLIAGRHLVVGEVCVVNDDENLFVRYNVSATGWTTGKTHLAVSADAPGSGEWMDERWQNRPGNPAPGRFPHSSTHPEANEVTYTIPLTDFGAGVGDTLHLGAHAEVDSVTGSETAWGDGERFRERGNWAMHFSYEVQ